MADLTVDGILGLDFLTEYNCSVNLCNQEITIGDYNKFQMVRKGHFGCLRAVTCMWSTATIPANRDLVVPGKVCVPESEQLHCCESLIEPAENKIIGLPAVVDFWFVLGFSSHSRIFHSYGNVTIAGEELQILTCARHS